MGLYRRNTCTWKWPKQEYGRNTDTDGIRTHGNIALGMKMAKKNQKRFYVFIIIELLLYGRPVVVT